MQQAVTSWVFCFNDNSNVVFSTWCISTTHFDHNDQILLYKFRIKCLISLYHATKIVWFHRLRPNLRRSATYTARSVSTSLSSAFSYQCRDRGRSALDSLCFAGVAKKDLSRHERERELLLLRLLQLDLWSL